MQKVLVIVGPTASGKSGLGVSLAKRFSGEIISADSRQVYKGLDIGTGKITKKEMQGVPHHLLSVASPTRSFSAGAFQKSAARAIASITQRGNLPIVVGGTGFYIDTLLGRIVLPDAKPNPKLRKELSKKSAAQLYAMLKKLDSSRAKALSTPSERNNKVRLIRALEIAHELGKSPKPSQSLPYDVLWIGMKPADTVLRKKIDTRLSMRIGHGMVAEAKRLHRAGLSYKRMEALGLEYRSLARLLQGKIDRKEFGRELQSDIWRYARKQIGYWNRNKEIRWFDPKNKKIESIVRTWLKK